MAAASTKNATLELYTALASLCSNTALQAVQSKLTHGIESAFRLELSFEYDGLNHAVNFDDLCIYFSQEGKIKLAFVYPGSALPKRLIIPGVNVPYRSIDLDRFRKFLEDSGKEFQEGDLNDCVSIISLNGIVFYFDREGDRRIDITAAFVATGA